MNIDHIDALVTLSKEELWQIITDKTCNRDVQTAALQRWIDMDCNDYKDAIRQMRSLINQTRRYSFGDDDAVSRSH